jgi:hypothetical protein
LQGLYYLLTLVAFGVIAFWLLQNDKLPANEPTVGLLRMKDAISKEMEDAVKQSSDG